MLGNKGQRSANPQDDGKKMSEFPGETKQQVFALYFFDVVRAELCEPPPGLNRC